MRTRAESTLNVIWNLLVRIVLVAALIWVVWRVRSVLITVILAAMLAYLLLPAVDFLCSRRFLRFGKRAQRLIATILVFIAFFVVVVVGVKVLVTPFTNEAKRFAQRINSYSSQVQGAFAGVKDWYAKNVPEDWRAFINKQDFGGIGSGVAKWAVGVLNTTLRFLENILELVLIPVLAFYFVLDSRWLKREFIGLVPPWRVREALRITRQVSGILQSYVIGQLILCVVAGVVTGIVLHLAGMNYAIVLAVLAGVTRAIPIIGPVVSGIPICILGALQSVALGLWLLGFVIVMHFAESKFLMPILIGERMKLHPAVILIVLLIGAELFGLLGMFLAAPIAAIVRELIYFYIVRPRRDKDRTRGKPQAVATPLIRSESI